MLECKVDTATPDALHKVMERADHGGSSPLSHRDWLFRISDITGAISDSHFMANDLLPYKRYKAMPDLLLVFRISG
jgi:hypothetical protein